jgi:hypothetical protein
VAQKVYFNASTYDGRTGHGYAKSQKLPSYGTGLGSERPLGSNETGIYTQASKYDTTPEEEAEFEEETFGDRSDIDKFVAKINKWRPRFDISRRADRKSFASSNSLMELDRMPTTSRGIAPFSSRKLYPRGFDGAPIGSGGAGQAFRTTGPYKRTGTQYGTSRAPFFDDSAEEDYIPHYTLKDLFDDTERALSKNRMRMSRLRKKEEELHQNDEIYNSDIDETGEII